MKFHNKILAIVCALAFLLCSNACTPKGSAENFYYFNTVIHVETHGTVISSSTKGKLSALFSRLENQFDANKNSSIVKTFNQMNSQGEISLSDDAVTVLNVAKDCYAFSLGKFNPCIYPLTKLWGFAPYSYTPNFTPPNIEEIEQAKLECDFNALVIENSTLSKSKDFIKLDLGGIVKGYATDKALELLNADGHAKGYVSVGSSSVALLNYSTLGITHPNKNGLIITCNTANDFNLSVSTSGDYEKYHVDSFGSIYSHIIDAETGYPTTTGVRSATILGVDGIYGDALTTAICLMQHDGSANTQLTTFLNKILMRYPQASLYVVYENNNTKQLLTNKTNQIDFTLHDREYSIVNI